ncbi:MAG: enoyl-CoA hydratase [Actinobacteria bacterium 69-20]|nr:enoyl-CoA hydratase/isomerase family protein [Actinomycetota bacterium]OJV30130.1 MAG: enoyl-CoA hydratase [Actinobacteria bacterium 69-20]
MTDTLVHVEREGAVGIIRLDRPPVNAINSAMHRQLEAAAQEIDADRQVRAVLLHGGPKAFAGGADIKEMAGLGPAEIAVFSKSFTRALDALAHLRVPTVAAITGYALGGGFELALTTDFRIVAEDALLGFPEITLGVIPGGGGTQRLPRLVGTTVAKRMIFTGAPIRGARAVDIGLAEEAVPAADVLAGAMAFADRLAHGATVALATAKRCIDDGMEVDLATGLRIESAGFAALFASEDQKHGMASFIADGPGKATFSGR